MYIYIYIYSRINIYIYIYLHNIWSVSCAGGVPVTRRTYFEIFFLPKVAFL